MAVQTLQQFAADLSISKTGQIRFRGTDVALEPNAENLHTALSECVYRFLYSHPDGQGLNAFQAEAPDSALIEKFSEANQVPSFEQEGWRVQAMLDKGAVLANRQGAMRKFQPGQFICADNHFPLREGSQIRVFHVAGSAGAQPGFYHVFGANSFDVAEGLHLVRLYFNVRYETAPEFLRILTKALTRYKIAFTFKIASRKCDFTRADTAVLYIPYRMFAPLTLVLRNIMGELQDKLELETPYFTKPIFHGVGFAEEPDQKGSFGSHRSELIAGALLDSRKRSAICPENFSRAFSQRVAQAGLSLDTMHLRAGSKADYSFVEHLAA